jgi:predicted ATP-binding protein involved in virulence
MILNELRLKNYRVFEEAGFSFSEKVTVLAGVNGRGKSSVLDAIALMLSRLLPQMSPARGGYLQLSESDITHGQNEAKIEVKLNLAGYPVSFTGGRENGYRAKFDSLLPQVRQEVKDRYGFSDMTRGNPAIGVYYTTDRAVCKMPRKLSYPKSDFPQGMEFAYRGALSRRVVDYKDFMTRFRNMVTLTEENKSAMLGAAAPEDIYGIPLLHNLYYLGDRAVQATQTAVSKFLHGFHDLDVIEDPLRLVVQKGEETFDLAQLSDGERSVIAMVIDLCKRLSLLNPNLESPLDGQGIVLIDEIELHLHPKWQRDIIEQFRSTFPNIQFIMTTHSPFVIQSIRGGELISLDGEIEAEYANQNIEDVAEDIMDIEIPQRSKRYVEMMEVASEYYRELKGAEADTNIDVTELKQKLDAISVRYSNDPFFAANLNFQWETFIAKKEIAES